MITAFAQATNDPEEEFLNRKLYPEHSGRQRALTFYLPTITIQSDHCHLKYSTGLCYRNIAGEIQASMLIEFPHNPETVSLNLSTDKGDQKNTADLLDVSDELYIDATYVFHILDNLHFDSIQIMAFKNPMSIKISHIYPGLYLIEVITWFILLSENTLFIL